MVRVLQGFRRRLKAACRTAGGILYGMTTFGWARDLRRGRAEAEMLFLLIAFGDLLGLPIIPPLYSLRLLPFVMTRIESWKRIMLRERDWTDLVAQIGEAE